MAVFSEISIRKRNNEIQLIVGQALSQILFVCCITVLFVIYVYRLPLWILTFPFVFALLAVGYRNVIVIRKNANKIIKEIRFLGIVIGRPKVYTYYQDELYFERTIMIKASVGQELCFKLCLKNKDEELFVFENRESIKKIEEVFIREGIITNKLPIFNLGNTPDNG